MARSDFKSMKTMKATNKDEACNPHQESVLNVFPVACIFSSSLSSAGELSSPSPRLFRYSYIACQDRSYKTIYHSLGLNEVQGENINVKIKLG